MTATLDAARAYADHGWPVFALSAGKTPLALCDTCPPHGPDHDGEACDCLTCHGYLAASVDRDRITAMFAPDPRRLVAIRTGAPSGTVVIDVDPRSGGAATFAGLDDRGLLPSTPYATTGGGGLHLLYRHPGGRVPCGVGKLGPGVDVKSDGGYIVAAPSRHPGTGRLYAWADNGRPGYPLSYELAPLHPEVLAMVRPAPRPVPPRPVASTRTGTPRLTAVLAAMLDATPGHRNVWLHWCACRIADMAADGSLRGDVNGAADALRDAALTTGLPTTEIDATFRHVLAGAGVTV